jgi:hypothetical protein
MHLPAAVRRALGLVGPSQVVLTIDEDAVRLRTRAQTLEHIRRLARPYQPKGRLASEELIRERRAKRGGRSKVAEAVLDASAILVLILSSRALSGSSYVPGGMASALNVGEVVAPQLRSPARCSSPG